MEKIKNKDYKLEGRVFAASFRRVYREFKRQQKEQKEAYDKLSKILRTDLLDMRGIDRAMEALSYLNKVCGGFSDELEELLKNYYEI